MTPDALKDRFRPIFSPTSVAVVGVSRDLSKSGSRYFTALVKAGYMGKLYPVNPREETFAGFKCYPAVSAIPGPVEYVIISVPIQQIVGVIDDCVRAKVRAIQMFTAGFKETGGAEGKAIERQIVDKARSVGCRIIGPNCIGIVNPSAKIPYGPVSFRAEPGGFGFISQSGGHGSGIVSAATSRGIGLSKGVSFGNASDLVDADFLEYLAVDDDTRIIGAYLEGTANGRRLFETIRNAARAKPVIVWKGGTTGVGAEAANSHTGSLAAPYAIWSAAIRQAGAVSVLSLEEFMDTALAFQHLDKPVDRLAVISGIVDGGGGDSVSATDACIAAGLEMPAFSGATRAGLNSILKPVGTILRNPLDLGNPGPDPTLLARAIKTVAAEPGIDLIIIQKHVDMLLDQSDDAEPVRKMHQGFIELRKSLPKPLFVVSPPGTREAERVALDGELARGGVPVYPSLERAVRALVNVRAYYRMREKRGG